MLSSETNHHHFTTAAVEISTEEPLNGAGKDRDFQVTRGMGLAAGPATAEARGAKLAATHYYKKPFLRHALYVGCIRNRFNKWCGGIFEIIGLQMAF